MYIEDYMKSRVIPLEFEIKTLNALKHHVHQNKVGTVFIGSLEECRTYIAQQRARRAVTEAEKGLNPFFTR